MDSASSRVLVTLKKNILDPQGTAIKHELAALGYQGIKDVRLGKLIEVTFDEGVDPARREALLREVGHKLFANPVVEDFRIE